MEAGRGDASRIFMNPVLAFFVTLGILVGIAGIAVLVILTQSFVEKRWGKDKTTKLFMVIGVIWVIWVFALLYYLVLSYPG